MRTLFTSLALLFAIALHAQQLSLSQWEKEAETNIRLLPKYGYRTKTEEQKNSDKEFVETVLKQDSTRKKASDHLIALGFKYLYSDIKTAMYRFNQAWLLDSSNTDVYWGFGAVYITLGAYAKAKEQYTEGLAIKPDNTHLLTDYGTYFMAQYYALEPVMPAEAQRNLDSAIVYMSRSYQLDPKDQNTLFKSSICCWLKGDCENAWKYYDECKALGGEPITDDYTKDLKKKCKRKK